MPYSLTILMLLLSVAVVSGYVVKRLIVELVARSQVDTPNHRTLHTGSIPRGGGIVIVLTACLALVWAVFSATTPYLFSAFLLIVLAWAALGWRDDTNGLSPRFRLLAQFVLAIITVAALGWVNQIEISSHWALRLSWLGLPLTVLGIVWMANLYNFMDGIDGMAASQAIVAATTFAFWFLSQGGTEVAVFCAVLAAASYGFLWHNWRPASIFMGDVGSLSLGAIFAILLLIGHNRFEIPVLSSVMLLFVFIGDATLTIAMRAARRERLSEAHSSHFYQRLAHAGYRHSYIVVGYIGLMLVCSLAATASLYWQQLLLPLWIGLATLILALAYWVHSVCPLDRAK